MVLFRHIQLFTIIMVALLLTNGFYVKIDFALAQENAPQSDTESKASKQDNQNHILETKEGLDEGTIIKDLYGDQYVFGTLQNISKLYWALGIYNTEDIEAIDNFLIINECEIFQDYYPNDFEWSKIRSITKDMIKEKRESFPKKFKFVIPVSIGRYDHERGGFPLLNNTGFINNYRIELSSGFDEVCGMRVNRMDSPYDIMLILENPLNYNFINLDEHAAQAYILRKQYLLNKEIQKYRHLKYNRLSFIRLRVTFEKYQGNINAQGSKVLAAIYGKVDGIDFFEDPFEQKLLKSVNFENGEIVEQKDHTNTETVEPTNETGKDTPRQPAPEQ